jgi:hypothetical protein
LPAEVRARIWGFASYDEYFENQDSNCIIEIHDYDRVSNVSITISQCYPTLFAASREARYEAAKVDGTEWMLIYLRDPTDEEEEEGKGEKRDSSVEKAFEIGINFKRDTVLLAQRFMKISPDLIRRKFHTSALQYRLAWFATLISIYTLEKIQYLQLSVTRRLTKLRPEIRTWWMDEGLELFGRGVLKTEHRRLYPRTSILVIIGSQTLLRH